MITSQKLAATPLRPEADWTALEIQG